MCIDVCVFVCENMIWKQEGRKVGRVAYHTQEAMLNVAVHVSHSHVIFLPIYAHSVSFLHSPAGAVGCVVATLTLDLPRHLLGLVCLHVCL